MCERPVLCSCDRHVFSRDDEDVSMRLGVLENGRALAVLQCRFGRESLTIEGWRRRNADYDGNEKN